MTANPDVNSPTFWEETYRGGRTAWDLGGPTPVFRRLLDRGQLAPGRIIVLGAGRGHDAREFARRGFAVTAVDFAAEAVQAMRTWGDDLLAPVEILQADIFDLPRALAGTFDYALEYVTFCAIPPSRRADYADVVARLLKPGGLFIDLAFPLDGRAGGPPFAVSVAEMERLFAARGFTLRHRESPPDSVRPRRGVEELLIFQKTLPARREEEI
jgi:SAM-dependent methyltransferase